MKIKNNSGVWLFVNENGKFLSGKQIEKVQKNGKISYRFTYTKGGNVTKEFYDTLNGAKNAMLNCQ